MSALLAYKYNPTWYRAKSRPDKATRRRSSLRKAVASPCHQARILSACLPDIDLTGQIRLFLLLVQSLLDHQSVSRGSSPP